MSYDQKKLKVIKEGRQNCSSVGLVVSCAVMLLACISLVDAGDSINCTWFTEPRGVLTTPNFPGPYELPLKLCYVIKRRPDTSAGQQKTVIYFTQFYLLSGVTIETYDKFAGLESPVNSGRAVAYQPVATDRPTELEIQSQFVVISVDIDRIPGVNLRVLYELMDVHGFNITYEVIPDSQPTRLNYSQPGDKELEHDVCILDHCRFNGWCLANANFTSYECRCFNGFRGPNCQYSKRCSPEKNRCNGGGCEHHIGGSTSVCLCPKNFTGKVCDIRLEEDPCEAKNCPIDQRSACAFNKQNNTRCECMAGNKLKGCSCESGYRFSDNGTNGNCELVDFVWLQWHIKGTMNVDMARDELLRMPHVLNVTVLKTSDEKDITTRFQLQVVRKQAAEVKQALSRIGQSYKLGGSLQSEPFQEDDLVITALVSNKLLPVREGIEPVVLSCEFRAPEGFKVHWYKDNALINPSVCPGNLWLESGQRTPSGVYTSYLGLDRVQYIDKGRFTCEVRHGNEVRKRSLQMLIKMVPGGHVTPLAQSVQVGRSHELTCTLRVIEKVQYRWFKNTIRDESVLRGRSGSVGESHLRKKWVQIPPKGHLSDPEYIELLYPAYSRLVIPAVSSYAEYQCQIEDSSGTTTAVYAHVFPYDNSSQYCPMEEYMGILWNRTVLGGHDVQACHLPWGPAKGDARRRCFMQEGFDTPRWEMPDFSECAYDEIYNIRKQVLALARGYQLTTAVGALRSLQRYIEGRRGALLPGEGNHIMETLHEILDYEEGLRPGHPERFDRKEALQLFLDCIAMTFSVANSVLDERFYAKLNEIIPQFVISSLDDQPADAEFKYSHKLFDIYAHVFKVIVPSEGNVAVYEASLDEMGVAGYLVRSKEESDGDKTILSLWVPKSLTQDYLSRLDWLQNQGNRSLRSKMVNFRAATKFKNGSVHFCDRDELHVNFRIMPTMNSTLTCALILDGSEVSFARAELNRVGPNEFSCALGIPRHRQATMVALYEGPVPVTVRLPSKNRRLLQLVCSSGGLFLSFLCALSVTCTTSCWNLIKCVKWNVCMALLAMFSALLVESLPLVDQWAYIKPNLMLLRQYLLLVILGLQVVVLLSVYAELFDKKFLRGGGDLKGDISRAVASPWLSAAILLGFAYGIQKIWDTDSDSYWGTLEAQVSVPSAAFTLLTTVTVLVYGLLHFEISIASEEQDKGSLMSTLSTLQRGLLRRTVLVAVAVFIHGITTSGYVQEPTGNLQATTAVLLALVIFLVYTAYCETDVFYHAVWAHYKKKQEVKSMASH